jgi:hypothetical protein
MKMFVVLPVLCLPLLVPAATEAKNDSYSKLTEDQRLALAISMSWDAQKGCGFNTVEDKKTSLTYEFVRSAIAFQPEMLLVIAKNIESKDLECKDKHAELTASGLDRILDAWPPVEPSAVR